MFSAVGGRGLSCGVPGTVENVPLAQEHSFFQLHIGGTLHYVQHVLINLVKSYSIQSEVFFVVFVGVFFSFNLPLGWFGSPEWFHHIADLGDDSCSVKIWVCEFKCNVKKGQDGSYKFPLNIV